MAGGNQITDRKALKNCGSAMKTRHPHLFEVKPLAILEFSQLHHKGED